MRQPSGNISGEDAGMLLRALSRRIDSSLMPQACVFCGVPSLADEGHICAGCQADLTYCDRVVERPRPFVAVVAPLVYTFPLDAAIKALKFKRKLYYVPAFGEILCAALQHVPMPVDALLPVPLHWWRHVTRGFNQADELCKPIREATGIPLLRAVKRCRATAPQSGLAAPQRRKNLSAAFRTRRKLEAKHVLIIDDVITTGETTGAIASVLLDAGVKQVSVLALARAEKMR